MSHNFILRMEFCVLLHKMSATNGYGKLFFGVLPLLRIIFFFSHGSTAPSGSGPQVPRSHSDTPHSVWLLWTSDRPVAETSTWQQSQEIDIHARRRTRNPSKRAAADRRLKTALPPAKQRNSDVVCYNSDVEEDSICIIYYRTWYINWLLWFPEDETLRIKQQVKLYLNHIKYSQIQL